MEERLSTEMCQDFEAAVDILDQRDDDVDERILLVLLAARNEHQQYHLSWWVEEVGIASKATMSRIKQTLEQRQVIVTSKDKVEVGRPRQRLKLAPDSNRSIEALVDTAAVTTDF